MFKRFNSTYFVQQARADEDDGGELCHNFSPPPGFGCTLSPNHEGFNHLAGIGDGYAVAEWSYEDGNWPYQEVED